MIELYCDVMLQEWRRLFPEAKPEHMSFEKYGLKGEGSYQDGVVVPYEIRPTVAIGSWKVAWVAAKEEAGVKCRWHDLHHTFLTILSEGQPSGPDDDKAWRASQSKDAGAVLSSQN